MKLFLWTLVALTLSKPVPILKRDPSLQEMTLAHTNPIEIARVHSPNGLKDLNLFLAAHTPTGANPSNSMAAGGRGPISSTPPNGGQTINAAQLVGLVQSVGGLPGAVASIQKAIATCAGGRCRNGNPAGTPQIQNTPPAVPPAVAGAAGTGIV
ncbi:hypothetical protein HDV03_002370 [Kappamyces sp. JEL0829]|nr:hypothetical protein HDV03_002370 [Kappamyces sp. JEL0829]